MVVAVKVGQVAGLTEMLDAEGLHRMTPHRAEPR
jgi:hypothetical protein